MRQISEGFILIDQFFIQSLKKVTSEFNSQLIYLTLRTIALAIILPIHLYVFNPVNENSKSAFTFYLQIILTQNVIELTRTLYFYFYKLKNKAHIINIALQFKHCLHFQDLKEHPQYQNNQLQYSQVDPEWDISISSIIYDFQNMEKVSDVSEEFRTIRENIGKNAIRTALQSQLCCYRSLGCLLHTAASFLLIYGAILCFKLPLPQFQSSILEIYLFTEIYFKPKMFTILVVIALIPVILIVGLLYICFCKKQQKANLPPAIQISHQMLSKCNECAICFQSYTQGQKVIVMKCSNLHIFHQICIKGWTRIKATCPICRHNLT